MKIDEFIELGYTEEQAHNMIKNFSNIRRLSKEKISKKIELFQKFGLTKDQIIDLTTKVPRIYRGNDYLINRFNYFIKKGFTKGEICKMIMFQPKLFQCSESRIENTFKFFEEIGLEHSEIKSVVNADFDVLLLGTDILDKKYKLLKSRGITDSEIKTITRENKLLWTHDKKNIKSKKLFEFLEKRLDKQKVNKLVLKCPGLLNLDLDFILSKIESLNKYGIDMNTAMDIFYKYPKIISYSSDRLDKVFLLLNNNFNGNAIDIVYSFPAVIGSDLDNLEDKLYFIDQNDLKDYIEEHPKCLMQSTELTEARFNYFKAKNITVTPYVLYGENKLFMKRYKLTREELIKQYYSKAKKSK